MVFRKGKGLKDALLFLRFAPRSFGETRCGIVVSQKVSKKATVRNKVKRRIKAIVKQRLPKIKKGTDLVLIAKPGLETKDFQEIEGIIDKLLLGAKIISG